MKEHNFESSKIVARCIALSVEDLLGEFFPKAWANQMKKINK